MIQRSNAFLNFKKKHKRDIALFLTWPVVENDDITEYKNLLHSVIETNLDDPSALKFKESFEEKIGTIDSLEYERKSVIGVAKIIIKKASQNLYTLSKAEFYVYGGTGQQRMISLLYNFKYSDKMGHENIIYSKDVVNSLVDVVDIDKIIK